MRVASSARDSAERILESDLEQLAMILTTLVAAVTYGWIEGYVIETPRGEVVWAWWFLGHFSTYSLAMAVLFACITGGFALIKGRSMFVRGKRYFLITFAGNYPFSWFVEDFAYFWFHPEDRLGPDDWTNWVFGGVWIHDPWRQAINIWIPNWYWPVLVFWLAMMLYAHRCTIYDNLVKDEIARAIVPRNIEIPVEVKKPAGFPEEVTEGRKPTAEAAPPKAEPVSVEPAKPSPREAPQVPTPAPGVEQPPTEHPILIEPPKKLARSVEAEEALKRLRARVLKSNAS